MSRPARPPSPPKPQPIPFSVLSDRVLVGAFAALVAARPLVAGDDPGRLRLTSGSGPVSFTLLVLVVLVGFAVWRVSFGRGRPAGWPVVPLLLAGVGFVAFASSRLSDRYARPGLFIAWEWIGLAVAAYLARRLTASANDSRGLLNVLLASAVTAGGIAAYQAGADRLGLGGTDAVVPQTGSPLAGDDEFYPELNQPDGPTRQPHGSFDSPETLLVFLMLVLPVAVTVAKYRRGAAWGRCAVAVPLVLIAAGVAAALAARFGARGEDWSVAMNLVTDYPGLGVGPGNFSRRATGVLTPHAAWLGMAATTGLIGLGLLAAAVAVALWQAKPSGHPDPADSPAPGPRWEFYLGGVTGLVLGFIWQVGSMPAEAPADEVFRHGATAGAPAAPWVAAIAVLETIRADGAAIGRAILIGAGLVLLYGLFSDAPGRPTILFPLFVLLAVAANLRRPATADVPDGAWTKPVRVVRVIATAGLAITYLVTAALPAWGTAEGVRQARLASRLYPDLHLDIERARPGPERANALTKARGFLLERIIGPLREASKRDPGNASLLLELARWRRPLWEYQLRADPEGASRVARDTREAAERAGQLDPHNPAAQRSLIEALILFRRDSATRAAERMAQINKRIALVVEREPGLEVPLRYRVVDMLLDLGESDEFLSPEITRLFELNRQGGHGKLTDQQKKELIEKAKKVMRDPPAVVLEEWTK
jgi:hypothetical protein